MNRIPLKARLDILRLPREVNHFRPLHPRLIKSQSAMNLPMDEYFSDPMGSPGVKEQIKALDALRELMVSVMNRDLFQQWLNSKEDWENVGITNCSRSCPVGTYLKGMIAKDGYAIRAYTEQVSPLDNSVSTVATGQYDIDVHAGEISVTDSSVFLDGFEIDTPDWASFFLVEVDKLANRPGIPDEINEEHVSVTKAECNAILGRISASEVLSHLV